MERGIKWCFGCDLYIYRAPLRYVRLRSVSHVLFFFIFLCLSPEKSQGAESMIPLPYKFNKSVCFDGLGEVIALYIIYTQIGQYF